MRFMKPIFKSVRKADTITLHFSLFTIQEKGTLTGAFLLSVYSLNGITVLFEKVYYASLSAEMRKTYHIEHVFAVL